MLHRTSEHAIISLRPSLIKAFLSGEKCVEIRRRAPSLPSGAFVWLYGKVPCGKVMAVARLHSVKVAETKEIWEEFSCCAGINWDEFDRYVGDLDRAAVLIFDVIYPLRNPVDLADLRQLEPGFQPPQFFRKIRSEELLNRLVQSGTDNARTSCGHSLK